MELDILSDHKVSSITKEKKNLKNFLVEIQLLFFMIYKNNHISYIYFDVKGDTSWKRSIN